jgi:hypothetical protein
LLMEPMSTTFEAGHGGEAQVLAQSKRKRGAV